MTKRDLVFKIASELFIVKIGKVNIYDRPEDTESHVANVTKFCIDTAFDFGEALCEEYVQRVLDEEV